MSAPCPDRSIPVNEDGRRIGQGHQHATISDEQVRIIRNMHEFGGIGYGTLAKHFEVSKSCIQHICNYSRRAQLPHDWKDIHDDRQDHAEEEAGQTT